MSASNDGGITKGASKSDVSANALSLDGYLEGIKAADTSILAKAITLVESSREADRRLAAELIDSCLPLSGNSVRIGVSGLPGAGKSTLLDKLGVMLVERGHRVAVLTIDPSSAKSGGSILGDKTRMHALARHPQAFIRPSPARGILGGVAGGTRASIILCEAGGYDVVFVETVGVGQSESVVADLVDFVLLLLVTGTGDELQAMKRGVIEYAHAIAITKADGANEAAAVKMRAVYSELVRHMHETPQGWQPQVLVTSSLENRGISELWSLVAEFRDTMKRSGEWDVRRTDQYVQWMRAAVDDALRLAVLGRADVKTRMSYLEEEVRAGRTTPLTAASQLVSEVIA